jgi:hypothetical protein
LDDAYNPARSRLKKFAMRDWIIGHHDVLGFDAAVLWKRSNFSSRPCHGKSW